MYASSHPVQIRWRPIAALLLLLAGLAACTPVQGPVVVPVTPSDPVPMLDARTAAHNFVAVVDRMEPVVEDECRRRNPQGNCDFLIVVDDRPDQPANAYQMLDDSGRPVLAFTLALIADARNRDEIAFVLGHEAAHHIEGHLPRTQQSAAAGAMILGTLATLSGGGVERVESAQEMGSALGARTYSKTYELEADRLGTLLTWRAGYDPARGAEFFRRLPDPGDEFLGSHPQTADREHVIWRTLADIKAGRLR